MGDSRRGQQLLRLRYHRRRTIAQHITCIHLPHARSRTPPQNQPREETSHDKIPWFSFTASKTPNRNGGMRQFNEIAEGVVSYF